MAIANRQADWFVSSLCRRKDAGARVEVLSLFIRSVGMHSLHTPQSFAIRRTMLKVEGCKQADSLCLLLMRLLFIFYLDHDVYG